ncbi:UNVERIFIED_CONTAM: hypothetical protein NCL1_45382 [Trichonephila clavipes]
MAAVNFLHHENPLTWAMVEPATLGVQGQRQTNVPLEKKNIGCFQENYQIFTKTATQDLFEMDPEILNLSQVMRMPSDLAPHSPNFHFTPNMRTLNLNRLMNPERENGIKKDPPTEWTAY